MQLTGETAGAGHIQRISGERASDGTVWVQVNGVLGPPLDRKAASTPNYNRTLPTGREIGLPGYEIAHVWGPGFGDEARDGLMYASQEVNQALQNHGIESRLRELESLARGQGVTIEVSARATSFDREVGHGHDVLKEASYHFEARMPDGSSEVIGEVDITAPHPGGGGHATVEVTGGSSGIWSLK
ncbi:MAG TPA: polymorphic toxin type 4 domain-containing protein [Vicinamibacteria bacterium]|nr:polymorphic toxin type 4 domain-containing protein [Vicinamibacteria bacterium]